jgi:hypothetical protein
LVCSEQPELIEWAVALEARDAKAAVELEASGSRHNPQAVVGPQAIVGQRAVVVLMAGQASARSAQGVPVRIVEARDESARSALYELALGCGAVSGSMEVAR